VRTRKATSLEQANDLWMATLVLIAVSISAQVTRDTRVEAAAIERVFERQDDLTIARSFWRLCECFV
jgi:hypothetical protein